jgi:hypothetical protein
MKLDGNLLIIGDSFCQDEHHWPSYLRSKISYPQNVLPRNAMRVHTFPGGGWWPIQQQIYANQVGDTDWFNQIKLLIIIHPFTTRVFCTNATVHRSSAVELPLNWSANDFNEATIAHSLYYKYIYNENFHTWAQIKWFDELDQFLTARPHITSIHLFDDKETLDLLSRSTLNAGDNRLFIPTTLIELVTKQLPSGKSLDFMSNDSEHGFYNHFTPYNNIVFADQLYKIINFEQADFDLTQFKPYE